MNEEIRILGGLLMERKIHLLETKQLYGCNVKITPREQTFK